MLIHSGILSQEPRFDPFDALVLAHTPGMPLEWIYAALRLGRGRRRTFRKMIDAANKAEFERLGAENAQSAEPGEGLKMPEAVCPGYAGAVPLYSQLDLRADPRSDGAIASEFGVSRFQVMRWRTRPVFCPLTGVRLIPMRGGRW